MANIEDVVDSLKGEALKLIKDEVRDLLTSARSDADAIIRETGEKIGEWLLMRARGELSDAELEALLYSRDQTLRQYKNTVYIQARVRVEKIAVGLVNLVLDKIIGIPLGA